MTRKTIFWGGEDTAMEKVDPRASNEPGIKQTLGASWARITITDERGWSNSVHRYRLAIDSLKFSCNAI